MIILLLLKQGLELHCCIKDVAGELN